MEYEEFDSGVIEPDGSHSLSFFGILGEIFLLVLVSYALLLAHIIGLIFFLILPAPQHSGVILVAFLISSSFFVLRLNDRVRALKSRASKVVGSILVFPGWLVLFLIELIAVLQTVEI